jgi:hypothetical protein
MTAILPGRPSAVGRVVCLFTLLYLASQSLAGDGLQAVMPDDLRSPLTFPEPATYESESWRADTALLRLPAVGPASSHQESPARLASFITESDVYDAAADMTEGSFDPTQWAWTKGDFRIVPYGYFWADMIYATRRTNPDAFTVFVFSKEEEGEPEFNTDARRSRFGIDVTGPCVPICGGLNTGGKLEIDFFGEFFRTQNQPVLRMRHAYWEGKNENWKILIGQTWDVISPRLPNTLNFSVGWFGGNIGFRRSQFRIERYLHFSPNLLTSLQLSLNQDVVPDFAATNALTAGIQRESAAWPVVEGRVGFTLGPRGPGCKPVELGMSGHYGETGFDLPALQWPPEGPPFEIDFPAEDDARFRSWSFNLDASVPITDRFRFQGEFFTGANLSPYLGGIGQGVCPCLRVPIRSTGGWCELGYDWTPWLHSYVGAGVDDPDDDDSQIGRIYNQFIFANLILDVTDKLVTGIEVTSWKTKYHNLIGDPPPDARLGPTAPGNAVVIDWMVRYGF